MKKHIDLKNEKIKIGDDQMFGLIGRKRQSFVQFFRFCNFSGTS